MSQDHPDRRSIDLDPAVAQEVESLIDAGQTIAAIKRVREATGLGLREAKELVDAWSGALDASGGSNPAIPAMGARREMQCPLCLQKVTPTGTTCPMCGARLPGPATRVKAPVMLLITGLVVLFFVGVIFLWLMGRSF